MTTVVITRHSSPFAGYGSVVLDCRSSTFSTDRLEEAQIEWYAFKDGTLVDSLVKGGGCPEYGLAVDPGDWDVICRIIAPEDSGVYATATESWTVSSPTYQAECWLDLDAVSDGTGTLGSPFNSPASASTYLLANHVDGATNQSALHIKQGTSWSAAGSFLSWGSETLQGRLVIDTYDTGGRPELTVTTNVSAITMPENMGIWIQDVNITGSYVFGDSVLGQQTAAIDNFFRVDGTHTTGLNTGVIRCDFSNFEGHGVFNHSIGTDGVNYAINGCADHFLLHDCDIRDMGNGAVFGEVSRYATTKDCTFGQNHHENNYRFSRGQHTSIIRDSLWEVTDPGANSNFRIHSVGATVVSELSIIGNTWMNRDPQVTADFDATPDSGVRHMREIWFVANVVDNRDNDSNGCMAWAVAYDSVIRHNQFYCNIPRFFTTRLENIGSLDASGTLITDGSNLWFDGNTIYSDDNFHTGGFFEVPSWFVSGLRFRNNLFVYLATGGDPKILDGGGGAAGTIITECNYNVRFCPDASAPWATGFSDSQSGGNSTLAQWQTNVSLDGNSTSDSAGDGDLVDVVTRPPDLDIGASSDAIGAAGIFAFARVDKNGHLRGDPYDAGADEQGVSTGPTAPSAPGGGVTVAPDPASATSSTVDPTVVLGAVSITPTAATATSSTVDPTVVLGGITITPAPAEATSSTAGPTVDDGTDSGVVMRGGGAISVSVGLWI